MSEIYSNTFTTTVNKVVVEQTSKNTRIDIYNGTTPLVAVSTTPTTGQYKVTITDTTNCTAKLESDYKTITLLTATGNAGEIHATINIEGKTTVNKTIPVASITKSSVIKATETKYEQLADRFSWMVRGNSASSMQLTQDALNIITKQVKVDGDMIVDGAIDGKTITGATIIGSTFRNQNDTFSVDSEGNIVGAQIKGSEVVGDSFSVEGELTADTITANKINSAQYPSTLEDDIQIEISSSGDDNSELYDGAIFATVAGTLDALPKFLNGKTVNIWIREDIYENIDFQFFTSGVINLYLDGNTVYGYVRNYMSSTKVRVYGGWPGTEEGHVGTIHPSTGCAVASRTGSLIGQESSPVNAYSVKIYGSDNKATNGASAIVGIVGDSYSTGYYKNVQFVNCDIGFRANAGGRIHAAGSSGVCSQYGFEAVSGGCITIANSGQCGGSKSNTHVSLPGQIIAPTNVNHEGGNQTTDPGNTAPTPTTTKTVTIKSNSGDTYRSSVYNNWKKDNTCRQGDYGYGDCNGCWFFGSQFNQFKGKSISKIELTIKRISGGSYSGVSLQVKTHNYTSRPSGKPSYGSSCGSVKIAVGSSGKLTITNSTILNAISNGTVKGFGIQSTYNSANYAVCSGSVTVKVTYTE
jgi:hypothetical protein|nr:MAG TPA: hypothetical protein [Caudoviricetes sp.]